jgi:hypothetical protein
MVPLPIMSGRLKNSFNYGVKTLYYAHRMATEGRSKADLQAYYRSRLQQLSERVIDVVEELFSKETTEQQRAFEDNVERRLRDGAKFIPRKRQSR